MLPRGVGFAALLFGVSAIAASVGASAQERRFGPGAPAARPAAPPAAMARPAAPPAMARPAPPPAMARSAAPAFRATPPQRPAMAPHAAPRIAAPPRPAAPHVAGPRPEFHRGRLAAAAAGHDETPRAAHRYTTGARARRPPQSARPSRKEQIETRAQQREQRIQQRRRVVTQRQRDMLSRQSTASGRAASIVCSSACSRCSRKSRKVSARNAPRSGCCKLKIDCSSASGAVVVAAKRSGAPAAAEPAALG